MQKGRCVLSRREIRRASEGLAGIETGVRFMNILADRLAEIARVKIQRMERDDKENDDAEMTDEPGVREQNRIKNQYGGAFSAISHFAFLDIERIGCRILGRKKLTSAEWIGLYGSAVDGAQAIFWQCEVYDAGR